MNINKLRLRAFRGATKDIDIEFNPAKNITLIFGENGTGKSTIIDGLTFLCEQSRGSLDDRPSAKDDKYLVSAGRAKTDVLVELSVENKSWSASFSGSKIVVVPPTGYPPLKVLRRSTLASFVEAPPSERFVKIKEFIETPGIEKSEQNLRDATKAAQEQLNTLVRDYANLDGQLSKLWLDEGSPKPDAITWAKAMAALDTAILEKESALIGNLDAALSAINVATERSFDLIATEKSAREGLAAATLEVESQHKKVLGGSELLSVMQSAKVFIEKNSDAVHCPVCRNDIDAKLLGTQLSERIEMLSELKEATERLASAQRKHKSESERLIDSVNQIVTKTISLESVLSAVIVGVAAAKDIALDASNIAKIKNETLPFTERIASAKELAVSVGLILGQLKLSVADNNKKISSKKAATLISNGMTSNQKDQQQFAKSVKKLGEVLKVVEEERKKFVESVFVDISKDISDLYERIHPGESIANVSLNLDPKKRGSLNLVGQFYAANDIPPQAYFSESHLDTLGLCIWLAFTKKFSPKNTLIVLDDVLSSVDINHLNRIIDLIDEEASNFGHVLITTHFRPWRDRYRNHQAAGSKIHFIELKEWAEDRGLLTDTFKPALDDLVNQLDPTKFERQRAASAAGIFLEFILDFLALKYAISLPRKAAQDYCLGELLDGFSSKKRALLRVEHLDATGTVVKSIPLAPLLAEIDKIVWIRNKIGCHFTVSGQEAGDSEVKSFVQSVVNLAEALICSTGGDIPSRDKTGSYWQSKSGACRLHPLKMP